MEANQKKILKAISLEIRHILEGRYDSDKFIAGDLEHRLNEIGVWRDRPSKPVEELPHLSPQDREARKVVDAYIKYREETGVAREESVAEFVRESAYTWANRLLALRCMESRGIIDEVIVQKEIYGGRSLVHNRFARKYPEACYGEDDGLYTVLINEFEVIARELPDNFNPTAPAIILKPSIASLKKIIDLLSGKIAILNLEKASDEMFMAQDMLGWAYQFWNTEEKARVFGKIDTKKGAKIEGNEIIPATQLYTEPYMVKYLVQNSLGAIWMGMHPESNQSKKWEYYVKDANRVPINKKTIKEITFIDPACGSGHFLVEAFDLFYDMYCEEYVSLNANEICLNILNNNLFGIEIDERAAQITKIALWMKCKEKSLDFNIQNNEQFHQNILATNIQLPNNKNHLEFFLHKYPEDEPLKSAIESVFEGLENAKELGSLLQIEAPVEKELKYIAVNSKQKIFDLNTGLLLSEKDYEKLKRDIILRLVHHFNIEATNPDFAQAFFSDSVGKGLSLFSLLDRRYDIVATNPPFMGSGNMGEKLKKYINKHYSSGKNDLYSAFILRNIQLSNDQGQIAMVTQQSWMFLKTFISFRIGSESSSKNSSFKGLLNTTTVETLAHLGSKAFSEITGEFVNIVLLNISKRNPAITHDIIVFRILSPDRPEEKSIILSNLVKCKENKLKYYCNQKLITSIKDAPLSLYCLPKDLIPNLKNRRFGDHGDVSQGSSPYVNKHVRFSWEVPIKSMDWAWYVKGGGYGKWAGKELWKVRWPAFSIDPKSTVRGEKNFYKSGLCYTTVAQGRLGVRKLKSDTIFSDASSGIFANPQILNSVFVEWNSRLYTYYARMLCGKLDFSENYLRDLPSPVLNYNTSREISKLALSLKSTVIQYELLEREFSCDTISVVSPNGDLFRYLANCSFLHAIEGWADYTVMEAVNVSPKTKEIIYAETGIPSGLYPLIEGYDSLPTNYINTTEIPSEFIKFFNELERKNIDINSLNEIKQKLYDSYTLGSTNIDNNEGFTSKDNIEFEFVAPIPEETFVEELSIKYKIHPISIFWLLIEGISKEKLHCSIEEKRLLTDKFTIVTLRLFGHIWPKQAESGDQIPVLSNNDGIIPITSTYKDKTLYEYICENITKEYLGIKIDNIEKTFFDIVNIRLDKWLSNSFFNHHTSQFKNRPIIWQLESIPITKSGRGTGRAPAFSCFIYYHKLDADLLPKIRSQYVGPLISRYETELRTVDSASALSGDQSARKVQLENWIIELKEFDYKLALVSTYGFSQLPFNQWGKDGTANIDALKQKLTNESIDKWSSRDDINQIPSNIDEFYAQESRYDPDINDGVRVNIAPLQKAGLLAVDVLAKKDVDKAIADRAEWRADERRWCREGKLPRPGWWKEGSK